MSKLTFFEGLPSVLDPDLIVTVDPVNKDYICVICHHLPCFPVNTRCCAKVYCYACISLYLEDKRKCPYCRESIDYDGVIDAAYISQIISGLTIKCLNNDCKEKFLVGKEGRTIFAHLKKCPWTKVICEDCKSIITLAECKTHLGDDRVCLNRIVRCTICDIPVQSRLVLLHAKSGAHLTQLRKKYSELKENRDSLLGVIDKQEIKIKTLEAALEEKKTVLDTLAKKSMCLCDCNIVAWSKIGFQRKVASDKETIWSFDWQFEVKKINPDTFDIILWRNKDVPKIYPIHRKFKIGYKITFKSRETGKFIIFKSNTFTFTNLGNQSVVIPGIRLKKLEELGGYKNAEDKLDLRCMFYIPTS